VTITEPFPDNTPLAYLSKVDASVKYISFEPLLTWVNGFTNRLVESLKKAGINWVIIGAQSKPTVMPKIEWVKEIVQACDKAGVKVFLKDNLSPLLKAGGWKIGGHKWVTFLRQEMPKER